MSLRGPGMRHRQDRGPPCPPVEQQGGERERRADRSCIKPTRPDRCPVYPGEVDGGCFARRVGRLLGWRRQLGVFRRFTWALMDSILSVISAIFALHSEVLLEAQWTQSDNWLSYSASSAPAFSGAACGPAEPMRRC